MARFAIPLCVALTLTFVVPAVAQTGLVTGSVTEAGRPIVGAPVTIERQEAVLTDQDGRFTDNVPAGKCTAKVALHGYQPLTATFTAEPGTPYVVSGYIKTRDIESSVGLGAAVWRGKGTGNVRGPAIRPPIESCEGAHQIVWPR